MAEHTSGDPDAEDRFVRLDDGDMHVVQDGKPGVPALLLIHGTPICACAAASCASFASVASRSRALASRSAATSAATPAARHRLAHRAAQQADGCRLALAEADQPDPLADVNGPERGRAGQ
ncbi:MAG TPA: hypothetical protein VF933_29035, partial [Streptosporangiaceae bacterium]